MLLQSVYTGMEYTHSFHENLRIPEEEEEAEKGGQELKAGGVSDNGLCSSFEAEPSDRPRKTLRLSSSCSSLDINRWVF
jgi:hypothetical protein